MPDKDTVKAFMASPVAVAVASLIFVYLILSPIVQPIQTIPGKLDALISKLDVCFQTHKLAKR